MTQKEILEYIVAHEGNCLRIRCWGKNKYSECLNVSPCPFYINDAKESICSIRRERDSTKEQIIKKILEAAKDELESLEKLKYLEKLYS